MNLSKITQGTSFILKKYVILYFPSVF